MRACTVPGCNRRHQARNYCRLHYYRWYRNGVIYLPAYEVDEIAVERAVAGDVPEHLTIAEREAVVRRLHARKMPDSHIAARLGMSPTGVRSIRLRLGLPAIYRGRPAAA